MLHVKIGPKVPQIGAFIENLAMLRLDFKCNFFNRTEQYTIREERTWKHFVGCFLSMHISMKISAKIAIISMNTAVYDPLEPSLTYLTITHSFYFQESPFF